jgi:AraC-like DNA-binding protein
MEAARLLTDKASATVAEIAHSVGYANGSYFIRLFKEEYGFTPKAFRNLCNGVDDAGQIAAGR